MRPAGGWGEWALRIERVEELDVDLLAEDQLGEMYGASVPLPELFAELSRVVRTKLGVLQCGETGTGKDLDARAIHEHAPGSGGRS